MKISTLYSQSLAGPRNQAKSHSNDTRSHPCNSIVIRQQVSQPKDRWLHSYRPMAIRQQESLRTAGRIHTGHRCYATSQQKDSQPRSVSLDNKSAKRNSAVIMQTDHHRAYCQPKDRRSHSYRLVAIRQQYSMTTAGRTCTGSRHQTTSQYNDSRPHSCKPIAIRQ